MSKFTKACPPSDEEGWAALRDEVLSLFTPGAPIDEVALFAGRQTQIQRLRDTVMSKGRHALIFGERGVGKTSIANIFFFGMSRIRPVVHVYIQCGTRDTYQDIWRRALRRIVFHINGHEHVAADLIHGDITPDELEVVLANFGNTHQPIIVFDEFDRMKDDASRLLMTETIKQFSNTPMLCTVVLVGVAANAVQIITDHQSLSRALVQVRMPRMLSDELKEVVTSRLRSTPISITTDALWRISNLSSGLPFYAHALGQASALAVVEDRNLSITENVVTSAIDECFKDVDQSLIDSHVKAVTETRKGNIFKFVLAACALTEQDDLGRFSAASVEGPLTALMNQKMLGPSFTFHLNELCTEERGLVLERTGSRSRYRYSFVQPIIQPFIIMKGLSSGIISEDVLAKYAIARQTDISQ